MRWNSYGHPSSEYVFFFLEGLGWFRWFCVTQIGNFDPCMEIKNFWGQTSSFEVL